MSRKKVIIGVLMVFLGFFYLLRSLEIIDIDLGDFVSFVLPVALILIGVWFIVRRRPEPNPAETIFTSPPPPGSGHRYDPPPSPPGTEQPRGQMGGQHRYKYTYEFGGQTGESSQGRVKYQKFAGDTFIDCCNVDLRNCEVSTFAGNNEIKLHGAKLSPGLNRLVVSGFVGDVRILVPADMPVLCTSSSFIGDVELLGKRSSGLGNTIDARTENYDTAEAKLYIAVNHFIGDVRVYVV